MYNFYFIKIDAIRKLCEAGLPIEKYFESCALYIEEYYQITHQQGGEKTLCIKNKVQSHQAKYNSEKTLNNKDENNLLKENNNIFTKKINITPYIQILPIILKKNQEVKIKMRGKWRIKNNLNNNVYIFNNNELEKNDKKNRNVDLNEILGHLYYKLFPPYTNQNNSSLTLMKEETIFIPDSDSLLLLSFNINLYDELEIKDDIELSVDGIKEYSLVDIFTQIGFDKIRTENQDLLLPFNLFRSNPKLFAQIFIEPNMTQNEAKKELYELLIKLEPLPLFSYSSNLEQVAQNLCNDLVQHNSFSIFDSKGKSLKKRIQQIDSIKVNLDDNSNNQIRECLCILKDNYQLINVVISLLIDELVPSRKNRKTLLNKDLIYLGFCIKKHKNFENIFVGEFSNFE